MFFSSLLKSCWLKVLAKFVLLHQGNAVIRVFDFIFASYIRNNNNNNKRLYLYLSKAKLQVKYEIIHRCALRIEFSQAGVYLCTM